MKGDTRSAKRRRKRACALAAQSRPPRCRAIPKPVVHLRTAKWARAHASRDSKRTELLSRGQRKRRVQLITIKGAGEGFGLPHELVHVNPAPRTMLQTPFSNLRDAGAHVQTMRALALRVLIAAPGSRAKRRAEVRLCEKKPAQSATHTRLLASGARCARRQHRKSVCERRTSCRHWMGQSRDLCARTWRGSRVVPDMLAWKAKERVRCHTRLGRHVG